MRISGSAIMPGAKRRLIVALFASSIAIPAISTGTVAEAAGGMLVTVDQAAVVRLSAPAGAIIVGNPAIADATVVDASTIVVTGRSFGTTNMIVLDTFGNIIADDLITVQPATDQVVVYRRAVRQTYSCTPICAPTLNVGDGDPTFQTTTEQIAARAALAAN